MTDQETVALRAIYNYAVAVSEAVPGSLIQPTAPHSSDFAVVARMLTEAGEL